MLLEQHYEELNKHNLTNTFLINTNTLLSKVKTVNALTFQSFIKTASMACIYKDCFKHYTPNKCAEETARRGNMDIIQLAILRDAISSLISNTIPVFNIPVSWSKRGLSRKIYNWDLIGTNAYAEVVIWTLLS